MSVVERPTQDSEQRKEEYGEATRHDAGKQTATQYFESSEEERWDAIWRDTGKPTPTRVPKYSKDDASVAKTSLVTL
jgi:hypothetical protein